MNCNAETLLEKAARLYPGHSYNQEQWLKAISFLGDKWLLNSPISKKVSGFQS